MTALRQTIYDHLQENLKLNGLTNFPCYRKARSDRSGQATLYVSGMIGHSSLVQHGLPGVACESMDVITGDELVSARGVLLPRAPYDGGGSAH